jgi:hypothetical protein
VDDASLTVTVSPVAVETVKPDADTLSTTPTVPPSAEPDRALDPATPDPGALEAAATAPGPDTWVAYAAAPTPIMTMATTAMKARILREDIGRLLFSIAIALLSRIERRPTKTAWLVSLSVR